MVKFLVFVCFLFLRLFALHAQPQNLVPNPSFEEHSCCPCGDAMLYCVEPWYIHTSTPDYFNACNDTINDCLSSGIPNSLTGIPKNAWGFSYAKDGNAYIGAQILIGGDTFTIGEAFGVELFEVLKKDVRYCYSFFVKLADTSRYTGYDVNIALTIDKYTWITADENKFHFIPNNNLELFSKDKWIEISGVFISYGYEKYLVVGNLKNDTSFKSPTGIETWCNGAYLYFDDFKIIECDSTRLPDVHDIISLNSDGINDTWIIDDPYSTVGRVQIFNRWGNIMYERKEKEPILWEPKNVSSGVYFYIIQNAKNPNEQKRGTITVLGGP